MTKRGGFTLVEILIVVTILGVLTSLLVATTRSSDKNVFLFTEQAQLIGVLARAKSLSIETFQEQNICGYGVHFTPSESEQDSYLLYRYVDAGGVCNNRAFSGNDSDIVSRYVLPEGLEFSTNVSGQLPDNLTDIFFAPPRPTIYIIPPQQKARIPLVITDRGTEITVTVSYAGQITSE